MREYFPFTDYDFYGYLACGLVFLFSVDYWLTGGNFLILNDWNFFQGAIFIAIAYVFGQVIAMAASIFIEGYIGRKFFTPPLEMLLGKSPRRREIFLQRYIAGRYYEAFPVWMRNRLFEEAETATRLSRAELEADPNQIFLLAFDYSKRNEEVSSRLDGFRNQYAFNRNMAFSGLLAGIFCALRAFHQEESDALGFLILALLIAAGMTGRFLKFYSCYAGEVLRSFALRGDR